MGVMEEHSAATLCLRPGSGMVFVSLAAPTSAFSRGPGPLSLLNLARDLFRVFLEQPDSRSRQHTRRKCAHSVRPAVCTTVNYDRRSSVSVNRSW